MKKLIPIFIAIIFFTNTGTTQTIIKIGTDSTALDSSLYPAPYGNFYEGAKHQFIIRESELSAAGMCAGWIYSITFDVKQPQFAPLKDFTIRIKNTSQNEFSTTSFESTNASDNVFGPIQYTENVGWNTHTFDTAFFWDGTSNLLVQTCFNNAFDSRNAVTYYTSTSYFSTLYKAQNTQTVCTSTSGLPSKNRPNMYFEFSSIASPQTAFTADNTLNCDGIIQFTDLSVCDPQSWQWDFGDGNIDTVSQNPLYIYDSAGIYTVKLIASNANGSDTIIKTNYIQVNPPVADFYVADTFSCTGFIQLSDISTCSVDSWLWDFGDGNTGTDQNPDYMYDTFGIFTIKLIITNAVGSDTVVKTNYILIDSLQLKPRSCMPATLNNFGGVGIYNVTFESINNTTGDGSEGYQDYSCFINTFVTGGQTIPISVQTNSIDEEHVKVWIDFNNDSILDNSSELVFSSTALQNHSGNIFIPSSAVLNQGLRMRVASEIAALPAPGPCDDVQLGQHEDYKVVILPSPSPPIAQFDMSDTITCYGLVTFTDQSYNIATSWYWDFGDGYFDTVANPTHTYTTDSIYTITLIAFNIYGSDTITNTIHVTLSNQPGTAFCIPTTGYCCGYGIYNVTFSGINNTSGDGAEGYQDFSCGHRAFVKEGNLYPVSIGTNPSLTQDTKVWIDYDNDGFLSPNELAFSALNAINPSGIITIQGGAVLNTPLRMRVASGNSGSDPGSCSFFQFGQYEDYTVFIEANTVPPSIDFTYDVVSSCNGIVDFTDMSQNIPTSWLWSFGDGAIDSVQNPTHIYQNEGTFTVTLIASNDYGSDTLIKTDYVTIICEKIIGTGTSTNCNTCYPAPYGNWYWGARHQILIKASELNFIGITLAGDISSLGFDVAVPNGVPLENFTIKMKHTTLSDLSSNNFDSSGFTTVWGPQSYTDIMGWNVHTFSAPFTWDGSSNILIETCFNNSSYTGNAEIYYTTTSFESVNWYRADVSGVCINTTGTAAFERPNMKIGYLPPSPTSNFTVNLSDTCTRTYTFTDLSTNNPDIWLWDFGDGTTETSQNPIHTFNTDTSFTIKLYISNLFGFDSIYKTIVVDQGNKPQTPFCTPATTGYCCGYGIYNFSLNGINNSSANGSKGYEDFSCISTDLYFDLPYQISIATNPDTAYIQDLKVWIDYNDDGIHDNITELIYEDYNFTTNTQGYISIPYDTNIITDTLLRLRIATDYTGPGLAPCIDVLFGQIEDYGVRIREIDGPPVADFGVSASTTIECEQSVSFVNLSIKAATFYWDFGDGITSSVQNPTHTYIDEGNYTITLIVTNILGSDTLIKTDYIIVNCAKQMPQNSALVLSSCTGKIYDSGGFGDYQNNTDGAVTISPPGAFNVALFFSSFNFDLVSDFLYIYDGADTLSVLIGKYNGTGLPGDSGLIVSSGGSITLRQATNSTIVNSGFVADWICDTLIVGINKTIFDNERLTIFPNPTTNSFIIHYSFSGKKHLNIKLSDIMGRTVYNEQTIIDSVYNREINLVNLPKGLYFLKITDNDHQLIKKIIYQ